MPRYMQGDKVSYVGEKLKGDFGNSLGVVCAPIVNNPMGYVVDFGKDSIVVHESNLAPFQGHLKGESDTDTKKKDVKVEKRRGGGGGRNKRNSEEE